MPEPIKRFNLIAIKQAKDLVSPLKGLVAAKVPCRVALKSELTFHGILPPVGIRVLPNEGTDNEANEIQRRAEPRHFERA